MAAPKRLSLALELADLRDGLEGVGMLVRQFRDPGALSHRERVQLVESVMVILGLLSVRIRHVGAAVQGDLDPTGLVTTSNMAVAGVGGVVLRGWSKDRRQDRATEEAERIQLRQKRQR